MSSTPIAEQRMTVRRMRFPYPEGLKGWWNPARPEFSHVVNAASLGMPYLEPYLIETMRKAAESKIVYNDAYKPPVPKAAAPKAGAVPPAVVPAAPVPAGK